MCSSKVCVAPNPKQSKGNTRVRSTKRCLFGRSRPSETDKMLEEQREIDQNRFQERFGVDLEDIENIDPNGHEEDENKKRSGKKQSTMERVAFKPYNRQFRLRELYRQRQEATQIKVASDNKTESA